MNESVAKLMTENARLMLKAALKLTTANLFSYSSKNVTVDFVELGRQSDTQFRIEAVAVVDEYHVELGQEVAWFNNIIAGILEGTNQSPDCFTALNQRRIPIQTNIVKEGYRDVAVL